MLNIKVTNRMLHEDYVADNNVAPYILPRKHIISVAVSFIVCALIVVPMPATWENIGDNSSFTAESRDYLSKDQSAQELMARTEQTTAHQENYDDYDIPSQFFEKEKNQEDKEDSEQLAANSAAEDIFVSEEDDEDDEEIASSSAPVIEGTWAEDDKKEEIVAKVEEQPKSEPPLNETPADPTPEKPAKQQLAQSSEAEQVAPSPNKEESEQTLAQENNTDITTPGAGNETESKITAMRPEGKWYFQTIKSGDTLSKIFTYLDLPYATLNRITKVAGKKDLRLSVNDPIYFLIDKENVVMEMVKPIGKDEQVRFSRMSATEDFKVFYENLNAHVSDEKILASLPDASHMPNAIEAAKQRAIKEAALAKAREEQAARDKANNVNPKRPRLLIAKIDKGENFARAAHRAGLTPKNIKTIEQIFKSKLNVNKLKVGDKFRVLFSGIGSNATLYAVNFETSRGKFETFINPNDQNYYGEHEFTPTAGIFRRFPLAGDIKVNSHFNPHRRHPVTKRVSPHNGVDFKAVVGTPVYAPADGTVTFSGYQRAAGYYVIISHANNFSTVYMHLSKSEVKRGQQVIVGQLIARSGNTGRTTGPHLHYEIRINDRPVNPLKIELPSSNHPNLAREQREAFANNVKILRAELQNEKLAAVHK